MKAFLECLHSELNLSQQDPGNTIEDCLRRDYLDPMTECPHIEVSIVAGIQEIVAELERLGKNRNPDLTLQFNGEKLESVKLSKIVGDQSVQKPDRVFRYH